MKKIIAVLLALTFLMGISAMAEGTMSYADYVAANLDDEVTVETYVQAKTNYWDGKTTLYTQDEDGAYFVYDIAVDEDTFASLVPGTKIRVTGFKSEWSGEVEIVDATIEIIEGSMIAEPVDVTDILASDELIEKQNMLVSMTGMTVEAAGQDEAGNDVAFLYNWDGSGTEGSDVYFNVSKDGATYSVLVRERIEGNGVGSDAYTAAQNLEIGQTVDLTGFLYWYEGVNPHITGITVK